MAACSKCKIEVAEKDLMECGVCKAAFHFTCAGKTEENFKKLAKTTKLAWKCLPCKGNGGLNTTEKTETTKESSDLEMVKEMVTNLSKDISNQLEKFGKGLQLNANKIEEVLKGFDEMKKNMTALQEKNVELARENSKLKETVKTQDERLDAIENRSRISNIEIREVPETKGEDVHIVELIGKAIGIQDIKEGDIQVAHRVDLMSKGRTKTRPIVVHMGSRYLRNKWLQKYREFNKGQRNEKLSTKHITNSLPSSPVYLNEHLTAKRKKLLNETKAFGKAKNIKYIWVKDAFILVKKDDNEKKVFKIATEQELEKFKQNFSD